VQPDTISSLKRRMMLATTIEGLLNRKGRTDADSRAHTERKIRKAVNRVAGIA
jgi:hypothetical protein